MGIGGGVESLDFPLLKAFRKEAKEVFLENGEVLDVVPTEACAECAKGALNLRVE